MKTKLLIEQHFHGCFGIDFNKASVDDILYLSKRILKYGIGGIFPTLVTDTVENTKQAVSVIKEASKKQTSDMAKIFGVHLEGIFLNPEKKGIHNPEHFMRLTPENYKVYCENLSAVPSTVETPDLDVLPVLDEVIEATGTADTLTPMWNGKSGNNELPPDFRNFTYKTLIEVLQGTRDIDSACEEMNKTWQVAAESFNPVTGVGIE